MLPHFFRWYSGQRVELATAGELEELIVYPGLGTLLPPKITLVALEA